MYIVGEFYNYFLSRHGPGVNLSEDSTVVTATANDSAVAYTTLPIPLGRLFQLRCFKPGIIVSTLTAMCSFIGS